MEKGLDLIAKGSLDEIKFLQDFYTNLESSIKQMKKDSVDESQETKVCPKCGAPMVLRSGPYGKFYGCSNYPKCKNIERLK